MEPEAVFAVSAPCAWSTTMSPLAEFTRRSPVASPIRGYPPEFLMTPQAPIARTRTSPLPVWRLTGPRR